MVGVVIVELLTVDVEVVGVAFVVATGDVEGTVDLGGKEPVPPGEDIVQ